MLRNKTSWQTSEKRKEKAHARQHELSQYKKRKGNTNCVEQNVREGASKMLGAGRVRVNEEKRRAKEHV